LSQKVLMERIAEKAYVTYEAVKNWKQGYNGPSDIEMVKICAEVLDIDYHDLLTSIESKQESVKMTEKEIALVENIFGGCIKIVYRFSDRFKHYGENRGENHKLFSQARDNYKSEITQLRAVIDSSSLFARESIRYKLHRILIDMCEDYKSFGMAERWEAIEKIEIDEHAFSYNVDTDEIASFSHISSRANAIETRGIWYLTEEKEMAEKLGYEYTDIPGDYYNNVDLDGQAYDENDNVLELDEFHIIDCNDEYEITPQILYKDMRTRLLKDVFAHDFPELGLPLYN
jgi:transcriptional regulator with XRE-family HTH domain